MLFHRLLLLNIEENSTLHSKQILNLDFLQIFHLDLKDGEFYIVCFYFYSHNLKKKIFSRSDSGNYEGVDESNVKLEITCNKFPPLRKVSKMLNGLGDDM